MDWILRRDTGFGSTQWARDPARAKAHELESFTNSMRGGLARLAQVGKDWAAWVCIPPVSRFTFCRYERLCLEACAGRQGDNPSKQVGCGMEDPIGQHHP